MNEKLKLQPNNGPSPNDLIDVDLLYQMIEYLGKFLLDQRLIHIHIQVLHLFGKRGGFPSFDLLFQMIDALKSQ
jgi:hypothetical protein